MLYSNIDINVNRCLLIQMLECEHFKITELCRVDSRNVFQLIASLKPSITYRGVWNTSYINGYRADI